MARKRQIDPGIWTSEQFMSLSIHARVMFIGLISLADDEGRIKGSPITLKAEIFPADNYSPAEVSAMLSEIVDIKLVYRYHVDGVPVLCLPTYRKWQYINKIYKSNLPPPPQDIITEILENLASNSNGAGVVREWCRSGSDGLYGNGIGNGVGGGVGDGVENGVGGEPPIVPLNNKGDEKGTEREKRKSRRRNQEDIEPKEYLNVYKKQAERAKAKLDSKK